MIMGGLPHQSTDNSLTFNQLTPTLLITKIDWSVNSSKKLLTSEIKREIISIYRTSSWLWSSNSIALTRKREDRKTTTRLAWKPTWLLWTHWELKSTTKNHCSMSVKSRMLTCTLRWTDSRVNSIKCVDEYHYIHS